MSEPLAVITNRRSTRNLRGDDWVEPLLAEEKDVAHFILKDAGEVPNILARCAAFGARTLVVNGGDGTADLIFGGLLNHDIYTQMPALALLPAGKTNMTTAGWSLAGSVEDALGGVLACRRAGELARHTAERPLLGLHRSGQPSLYGAFFGAAEVVEGIHFCRRHIYPMNLPNAVSHSAAISILLWRSMFAHKANGQIEISDRSGFEENGSFFAVAVTALDQLLLGIRPQPGNSDNPAATLTYLSLRQGIYPTLRAVGSLASRRIGPGPGRVVRKAEKLTLNFTGAYTLDGELYEATPEETLTLDGGKRLPFVRLPKTGQYS